MIDNKRFEKQSGASMFVVILFLAMASTILSFTFKVAPAYYDNWLIKSVIESMAEENNLEDMSVADIEKMFDKRLSMNSVYRFNTAENLIVEQDEKSIYIGVDYEVRTNIFSNLDALIKFEEVIEKSL